MVKRNISFLFWYWLGRSAGIVLFCGEPLLIALLLWSWTFSTPLEKITLLFFIVWGFPLAFSMLRVPRQRLRVESLRMRMNEAPLFEKQPYERTDLPVPVRLTIKLSRGTYLVFSLFWLLMLGVVLIFQTPYFLAAQILWWVIGAWVVLGALVLGAFSLGFYQRIEVGEDSLMVQRGWLRGRIPWNEARLFAVLTFDLPGDASSRTIVSERASSGPRIYELSSARTILRWVHGAVGPAFTLHPRDRQEYQRLMEEVRAYIRMKTGLMVLDLR